MTEDRIEGHGQRGGWPRRIEVAALPLLVIVGLGAMALAQAQGVGAAIAWLALWAAAGALALLSLVEPRAPAQLPCPFAGIEGFTPAVRVLAGAGGVAFDPAAGRVAFSDGNAVVVAPYADVAGVRWSRRTTGSHGKTQHRLCAFHMRDGAVRVVTVPAGGVAAERLATAIAMMGFLAGPDHGARHAA